MFVHNYTISALMRVANSSTEISISMVLGWCTGARSGLCSSLPMHPSGQSIMTTVDQKGISQGMPPQDIIITYPFSA